MNLFEKLEEMFEVLPPPGGITERATAVYLKHLSDLPEHAVCDAIDRMIDRAVFTPKIGEIRSEVMDDLTPEFPLENEAWSNVLSEIGRHGVEAILQQPSILEITDLEFKAANEIGWKTIGWSDERDRRFIEADFKRRYRDLAERKRRDIQTGVLPLQGGNGHAQLS